MDHESTTVSIEGFRAAMPVAQRWAYFDHAAVAPLPAPSRAAVAAWADQASADGDVHWPDWNRRLEDVRRSAARLVSAEADEIALVHSTTEGISLVAEGYPWRSGDNVVTLDNEFPSNLYPWLNLADRGVEVRRVKTTAAGRVDLGALAAACDDRTRIVTVSWVGFATGFRVDVGAVAEIAHARGALFFLDAIQGLGVFDVDVRRDGVDFLAADGHKWLLGPEGAGLFYVRQEHLNRLRPLGVGWNSVRRPFDYSRVELDLKPNASRYEGGTQNMVGFLALRESLQLAATVGRPAIERQVLAVTDLACERLAAAGATIVSDRSSAARSGIVAFEVAGQSPDDVRRRASAAGVVLSVRGGRLRISPHGYADEGDVDRLVSAVRGE